MSECETFVGRNHAYYETIWHHLGEDFFVTWNWAAFLLGALWLFYRKLYTPGVIVMLVSIFVQLQLGGTFWGTALSLGLALVVGAIANFLYLQQFRRVSRLAENRSDQEVAALLSKSGGVSIYGLVALLGIQLLISAI